MSAVGMMRVKKLKGGGIVTAASRHNKREIQAELGATGSIDSTQSHSNEALLGPSNAAGVGQLAKDLMAAAGVVKLRKDAVVGLEFVFSLPSGHCLDDVAYFAACAEWVGAVGGGGQNVLSVDIHRDEAAPHCHVLVLPLVEGRMKGSDLIGGKQKLALLHNGFHCKVASLFGLSKAPARLSSSAKQAGAKAVLQKLRETSDSALQSAAWAVIRDAVERDPTPFLLAMGIEVKATEKKPKRFVDYVTSKGKGPTKEAHNPKGFDGRQSHNPIGFSGLQKEQTLCSVGFAPKPALVSASKLEQPPSRPTARPPAIDIPKPHIEDGAVDHHHLLDTEGGEEKRVGMDAVRDRDEDHNPALYDPDTGEYFARPSPAQRRQQKTARAWVATACAAATRTRH